jgi:hypothetical protein
MYQLIFLFRKTVRIPAGDAGNENGPARDWPEPRQHRH